MKKWFLPLVILLIIAFVISGCGTKTTATTPAKTTAAATTTATGKPTTTLAPTTKQPKYGGD